MVLHKKYDNTKINKKQTLTFLNASLFVNHVFLPKSGKQSSRGVLARKPIWIRYGSTTNSNIEDSSANPAAIESSPVGIFLFCFRKDKYCLSKNPTLFRLFGRI